MTPPRRGGPRRRPEGAVTRGTTAPNRLRRVDRWVVTTQSGVLRTQPRPLVVDLGYGASPVTTAELFLRLRRGWPAVEVVGLEIDPARVAAGQAFLASPTSPVVRAGLRPVPPRGQEAATRPGGGLSFRLGGFELPVDRPPVLIRAFNVLRQYDERQAWQAWERLRARLAPGGLLVEGTCDEVGRRAVWVALDRTGPRTITFATHLASLPRPSELAARLPKTLIHRNVPGEPVHALLSDFDRCWAAAAPHGVFGARQRWLAAVAALARTWPVVTRPPGGGRARWRLGEVTLPWSAVAPAASRYDER